MKVIKNNFTSIASQNENFIKWIFRINIIKYCKK